MGAQLVKEIEYSMPKRHGLDIVSGTVKFWDDQTATVRFNIGETFFEVDINLERRECDDNFKIEDSMNGESLEASTADILNQIIDCELLADDLGSEWEKIKHED